MSGGSQQLRIFRRAIRDGVSIEDAAAQAGISIGEARDTVAADAKEPPPPEAYVLLGHNSEGADMTENVSADQLRQFVERAERLIEEKKGLADDLKDVMAEAKSMGFDVPTIRECIKLRAQEKHKRDEKQALIETYGVQLGLF